MASGRKTWGFVEHSFALTGVAMLGLIFFRRVDSLELNRSGNISEVELEEVFEYFTPNSLVVGLTLMQGVAEKGAAVAFADVKTTAKVRSSAAIAVGRQASSTLFRTELRSSAWTGFLAGCLHTLSGPDHLAPLSIGCTRMESAAGQLDDSLTEEAHALPYLVYGRFTSILP